MQKFLPVILSIAASFCLSTAAFAEGKTQANNGLDTSSMQKTSASQTASNKEYNLSANAIEKLYKQTTDGMSATNIGALNPGLLYSQGPLVPVSGLKLPQSMQDILSAGVPTQGLPLTDTALNMQLMQVQQQLLAQISDPMRNVPKALAGQLAVQTMLGNSFAQITTANANAAINYTGKYLINFTVQEGNVWNKLRNNIFVPIALLLLVPGTILTQTKVMMSAGNPVVETGNPFEGILRAIVAMCFIPGSYLIINYGIDFSNSISHSIQDFYKSQFGTDMYADAFKGEQRAFPARQAAENTNNLSFAQGLAPISASSGGSGIQEGFAPMAPFLNSASDVTGLGGLESQLFKNKSFAPDGTQQAIEGMTDELMPASEVAARLAVFGSNMAITTIWDLLCAFQLIYLHYLFLVGPIMAAIWVYPVRQLREAWPNWVAGVITLCFWSLFWNTAVLLMALFNNADATGTFIMTALNCLATGSVKYAFDFVGLITEAGQTAVSAARSQMQNTNQNPLVNPNPALNNLSGLSSLGDKALGKTSADSALGSLLGGQAGSALTAQGLGSMLGGGACLANGPLSASGASLGNQLMNGLSGATNSALGPTAAMKDWTNGLAMPPLTSLASGAVPGLAGLPGMQTAALTAALSKQEMALPPLTSGASSMLNAAQNMMPSLTGQANIASQEIGKLSSAVSDSKAFANLMSDPLAAVQKGAQAINMDPSKYGEVPLPGAPVIGSQAIAASQFVANALDSAAVSSAMNAANGPATTAGSAVSTAQGLVSNADNVPFGASVLTALNNAVSGISNNMVADNSQTALNGQALPNSVLNTNSGSQAYSQVASVQADVMSSVQAQLASQVNAQSIASVIDATAGSAQSITAINAPAATTLAALGAPPQVYSTLESAPILQAVSAAPVVQAMAAAPILQTAGATAVQAYAQPAPQAAQSGPVAFFKQVEATRQMEANAQVQAVQMAQTAPPAAADNGPLAFFKQAEASRQMEAKAAAAANGAPSNPYPESWQSWAKPM